MEHEQRRSSGSKHRIHPARTSHLPTPRHVYGIVPCLQVRFFETATQLCIMENGGLNPYLRRNKPPSSLQISLLRAMALTLAYIHNQKVIVTDITCRNFLLGSNLSTEMRNYETLSMCYLIHIWKRPTLEVIPYRPILGS
ncbi:uncharacterized protein BO80DRAFT_488978 [Aspergillus ibericus CBS 121593]|uniref:Protein kinase domain-containing protein n=1 Tax=Aspergillus ibericus CBS 121593 TaxID=1448316 RepID=A0A395GHV3_9EURO|nr:hypothetical protein BO80DRAFT_488978 [Aspergillus ibericus CBS 121593]RAK95011.1 hypothetical protein BO80DRAFT_488978 [Aspergillus ibericus CBS 121593]